MKQHLVRGAAFFMAAVLFFITFAVPAGAAEKKLTGKGIYGNGTWSLYIDIYDATFTNYYKNKDYGSYGYGNEGCAWFASARVSELTGLDCIISSGTSWYNERYDWYGFTRGTDFPLKGKALACYDNHVSVIEAVDGETYLVSECGISTYKENDYCSILVKTKDQIKHFGSQTFIGFVYLGDVGPIFRADKKPALPQAQAAENGIQLSWNAFDNATGYRIYRKVDGEASWTKQLDTAALSWTDTTAAAGTLYRYTVRAYKTEDGTKTWSKYNKTGTPFIFLDPAAAPKCKAADGKITVSFSAVTGAQGYLVQRKAADGTYQDIADLPAGTLKYADKTIESAKTYQYRVLPYTKAAGSLMRGTGADSAAILAYKTPAEVKIASIYETLSGKKKTIAAELWFTGNGSDDYTVYRREEGKTKWKKLAKLVAGSGQLRNGKAWFTYTDASVKADKTYEYAIGCHRVVGTHDLQSTYGSKKRSLYVVGKALWNFLEGFQEYGELSSSSTRVYDYGKKKDQKRLLKELYAGFSCYELSVSPYSSPVKSFGTQKNDPYKKFTGAGFLRIREKALTWSAKNIFHVSDKNLTSYRNTRKGNKKAGETYIKGKFFYVKTPGRARRTAKPRILSLKKKNGYTYLRYRLEDGSGGKAAKEVQYAVLKKEKVKGKGYWTLYTHNTGKYLNP